MPQLDSLPTQLFLLALHPHRERLTGRTELGYLLRAGALVELQLRGYLGDEDGRPVLLRETGPGDAVLDPVHRQVAEGKRRRWPYWIKKDAGRITRAVRDQLVADRQIVVEPYRILGLLPAQRLHIVEALRRPHLVTVVEQALDGGTRPDDRAAALVALSAAAELAIVLPRSVRRAHRDRIATLTEQTGPVAPALRKVVRDAHAAVAAGAGA
jgi:hypothetical protein